MSELNDRELRVLKLNADGLTQREIAHEMGNLTLRGVRYIIEKLRDQGHDISINKYDRSKINMAEEMFSNGKTNQEIAAALDVDRRKVSRWRYSANTRGVAVPTSKKPPVEKYSGLAGRAMDPADLKYGGRRFDD